MFLTLYQISNDRYQAIYLNVYVYYMTYDTENYDAKEEYNLIRKI